MALSKLCILFTFGKVKVTGGNMVLYWTKIYRNDDPYRHNRMCMQNFAAVCRAISEEIADRQVSQLSFIIYIKRSEQLYQHTAEPVIETQSVKFLWDMNIQKDHVTEHR